MHIIDNCISETQICELYNFFTTEKCKWYYTKHIALHDQIEDRPGYFHSFVDIVDGREVIDTNNLHFLHPFIDITKKERVIRATGFLQLPFRDNSVNGKHVDLDGKSLICLYYVNDSDGGTVFYDKGKIVKRIDAKRGRCVIFDGGIEHSGISPTNTKIVLNMNLKDA